MKFAASILTALVASASALSLEKRMQLLEKATPLGKNRKLEENQGFQITAYDSIQFNSCISLETQLSDEMKQTLSYSSDLLALWESGDIVSQKSVVLFSVCKTEYCSYKAEDNLYVVPLADYMALTQYRPQKQLDYCEACEQAYDWCTYDQYQQNNEEAQQDGEAEAENEGGRRKLENRGYVDCGTCESNGCWENMQNEQNGGNNGQNNGQITLEGMVEYVQQLSECQETGAMWNNMNLYSSFMCNDDGTGVEVAVFLDNECETYTSQTSYSALFPNDSYLYNSHSVVTYPFLNDIDCAEQMEWSSPEELYNQQQNGNQEEQQDNGEEPEANEFCRQLINEDLRPINDCNNNGQDDAEEEQEQNQNEEYDYFSSQVYDLTADQADDAYYLCKAVAALQSEGSGKINAKAKNPYNSQSSGHVYTYKKTKSSGSGSNGGKVAGIIIGLLAAAGVGFFVFQHVNKKKDDRKEPLVNDAAMA